MVEEWSFEAGAAVVARPQSGPLPRTCPKIKQVATCPYNHKHALNPQPFCIGSDNG